MIKKYFLLLKMQHFSKDIRASTTNIDQSHQSSRDLRRQMGIIAAAIALLSSGCDQVDQYLPRQPILEAPSFSPPKPQVSSESATTAQMEVAIRQGINQVRRKNGLQPLQNNLKLAQVARKYSRFMAEKEFFSHTGADGSTLADRVQAGGVSYWYVGENLFTSTNVPQPVSAAIKGWMNSPGHRENILRPIFTETGVGVWRVGKTYYITQLFLRRPPILGSTQ